MKTLAGSVVVLGLLVGCAPESDQAEIPEWLVIPDNEPRSLKEEAHAALLRVSALPTGWTGAPPPPPSPSLAALKPDSRLLCGQQPIRRSTSKASVYAEFRKVNDQLLQNIKAFDSTRAAKKAFDDFKARGQNCTSYKDTSERGITRDWHFSALSFPNFAHETLAIRVTAKMTPSGEGEGSLDAEGNLIVTRSGGRISTLFHVTLGVLTPAKVDSAETETIARKCADRLTYPAMRL